MSPSHESTNTSIPSDKQVSAAAVKLEEESDVSSKPSKMPSSSAGHVKPEDSAVNTTKEESFNAAADDLEKKMMAHPEEVAKVDASHLESTEARLIGHRPAADSISAEAKRMAAANEKGNDPTVAAHKHVHAPVDVPKQSELSAAVKAGAVFAKPSEPAAQKKISEQQSHVDKEHNFLETASKMEFKLQQAPESITKEDAALLQSRDRRAHGQIEKDGVTALVQSVAAENARSDVNV